jgi:uncharacterized protein YjgD (DUF1641 family)
MSIFQQIKQYFSQPDQEEVIAYQYKIPHSITVAVTKEAGCFIAKVVKINNEALKSATFMTEAKTMTELVIDINDMLLTYLDFPENIKPKMPQLLPPEFATRDSKAFKNASRKELVFAK